MKAGQGEKGVKGGCKRVKRVKSGQRSFDPEPVLGSGFWVLGSGFRV